MCCSRETPKHRLVTYDTTSTFSLDELIFDKSCGSWKKSGFCGGTKTWHHVEIAIWLRNQLRIRGKERNFKKGALSGYILCQASIASSRGNFWRHRFNMHFWRFWISFRRLSNSKKMGWNPEMSSDTPKTTPPLREYLIPQLDLEDDPFIFFGKSGETKKNP